MAPRSVNSKMFETVFFSYFAAENIKSMFAEYVGKLPEFLRVHFDGYQFIPSGRNSQGMFRIKLPSMVRDNSQYKLFGDFLATVVAPGTRFYFSCRTLDGSQFGMAIKSGKAEHLKFAPLVSCAGSLIPVNLWMETNNAVSQAVHRVA